MRNAFFQALTEIAEEDERVMFLTADLGFRLFDEFAARYPNRFLNMGVSEANMVSVAVGLALSGRRPFTYSIAPFSTIRCLEQIRNDLCGMNAPVVVVGVGGGYAYGNNGSTHHGIDDIAAMRAMPGMTVVCPCDPRETVYATRALVSLGAPAYLRLGRNGEAVLPGTDAPFRLGEPTVLREGDSIALLATGQVAEEALQAAELLARYGLNPLVLSVHTVKPLRSVLDHVMRRSVDAVFVVEEHGPCGGLSEALAVKLAVLSQHPPLIPVTAPDRFVHDVGSQAFLRRATGLDAQSIARLVLNTLEERL